VEDGVNPDAQLTMMSRRRPVGRQDFRRAGPLRPGQLLRLTDARGEDEATDRRRGGSADALPVMNCAQPPIGSSLPRLRSSPPSEPGEAPMRSPRGPTTILRRQVRPGLRD
jgi:hypothetical protein